MRLRTCARYTEDISAYDLNGGRTGECNMPELGVHRCSLVYIAFRQALGARWGTIRGSYFSIVSDEDRSLAALDTKDGWKRFQ